jgi:hypothetical protein
MKSAAKCVNPCEPQNTWSIDILNVNGGPASRLGPHLTEGRYILNERFWVPDERRACRGSSRGVAAEGLRGERRGVGEDERGSGSPGPRVVGTLTARSLSRPGSARRWEGLVVAALAVTAGLDRWRRFGGRVIVFSDASNTMGVGVGERESDDSVVSASRVLCASGGYHRANGGTSAGPRGARATETRAVPLFSARPCSIDLSCRGYWRR